MLYLICKNGWLETTQREELMKAYAYQYDQAQSLQISRDATLANIVHMEEQLKTQDQLLISLQREYDEAVKEVEHWENGIKDLANEYDKMELIYKIQLQEAQAENKRLRQANQVAITNMITAQLQVQSLLTLQTSVSQLARSSTNKEELKEKEKMQKEIEDLKKQLEEKTKKLAEVEQATQTKSPPAPPLDPSSLAQDTQMPDMPNDPLVFPPHDQSGHEQAQPPSTTTKDNPYTLRLLQRLKDEEVFEQDQARKEALQWEIKVIEHA